jgi:hypothetical protein
LLARFTALQPAIEFKDFPTDCVPRSFSEVGRDETNHYGFGFADPDRHKFNALLMEEVM